MFAYLSGAAREPPLVTLEPPELLDRESVHAEILASGGWARVVEMAGDVDADIRTSCVSPASFRPGVVRSLALTTSQVRGFGSGSKSPWLFFVYLGLHVLAVAGIPPGIWPDSASYGRLNLLGDDLRLPTVPLLYWIAPTGTMRVWLQVVLAAVAWWVLALVASRLVDNSAIAVSLRLVMLALGLSSAIVSWNTTILSESAAISFTVLLIAALLRFRYLPAPGNLAALLFALLVWTFVRQPHVLMAAVITAVLLVASLTNRRKERRVMWNLAAIGAVAIAVAGVTEIHRNQTVSRRNAGAIVQIQILPNRQSTQWFIGQGMPYSHEIARYAGIPFSYQKHDRTYTLWLHWVNTRATSTYLRFLLTHPGFALFRPLAYFPGEQPSFTRRGRSGLEPNATTSMLSPVVDYGRHRDVLPSVVDRLLFDQGNIGDVVALVLASSAALLVARRRYGRDPRVLVPLLVAASAVPQGYIAWLGGGEAGGELDRLSVVAAVCARVGLWLVLALSLDRLIDRGDAQRLPTLSRLRRTSQSAASS